MLVLKEEVFGPIAALVAGQRTGSDRFANGDRIRPGRGYWTRDVGRAQKNFAREIDSGFVAINCIAKSDPRLPFGGVKIGGLV